MNWKIYSTLMIVLGIVYIIKPNIYRRGIWKETDIAQRRLTEKQYNIYMRVLGAIVAGIGVFVVFKHL